MFQQYRKKGGSEMRPYIVGEVLPESVSISDTDRKNGSPKVGDMIARNVANHDDQWLVAAEYFSANFDPVDSEDSSKVESLLEDNKKLLKEVEYLKRRVEVAERNLRWAQSREDVE